MTVQRVNPGALKALILALSRAFWYKKDLRLFLHASIADRALVSHLDWDEPKWRIANQLVDTLAGDQDRQLKTLLSLMFGLCDITDPAYLKEVEDGEAKYQAAVDAIEALRKQIEPYRDVQTQAEEAARRRQVERARADQHRAMATALQELNQRLWDISKQDAQTRGYGLEKLLNDLFKLYDIDAKAPFRIQGEQIDGAFTFENTEFILEAKWKQDLTPSGDLDVFARKVERKLDNTLGLFLSMNGFAPNAVELHSRGQRPSIILMTGADLAAVFDDRIALSTLISRKRQHAARTGSILVSAADILS